MNKTDIILRAILSQDLFDYLLADKNGTVFQFSEGIGKYIDTIPRAGDMLFEYLPELIGYEKWIDEALKEEGCHHTLKTIQKQEYYVDLHVEHYSSDTVLILLRDITDITLSKLKLLQYSNENTLLYNTIQKIIDSQNNLLLITYHNRIEYANRKLLDYFDLKDIQTIKGKAFDEMPLASLSFESFDDLYLYTKDREQEIGIGKDTFLAKATLLEKTHKLFTFSNVTHLSSLNRLLKSNINHDPLTGIYRKHYSDKILREELQKQSRFALVMLDIDNFKHINDTYGHMTGDKALKELTALIQKELNRNDIFARWGGEEFLILLRTFKKEESLKEESLKKVKSIRASIAEHLFSAIGHMTASFGLALPRHSDSAETLFERADQALYLAKDQGKNRVVFESEADRILSDQIS
ncbi:MAG TPA: GGDEF domain-containing protein [Epsilonproteobacteria bacterium]|nr:GGDEF domain-containing protein [Campylobacterota bacterium]